MPVLDRREPGVYVTIEDASYVAPAINIGRTVYAVGITTKGPHNRVVEITSQVGSRNLFGQPDFHKTTQSYYCFDAAMALTNKGLFVRVMPTDSKLSNIFVKENASPTSTVGVAEEFTFTEGSTTVEFDNSVENEISAGQWIYAGDGADGASEARQIISIDTDANEITLNSAYDGSTSGWGTKSNTAVVYTPYITESETVAQDAWYDEAADVDSDVVYAYHAYGAGDYYDKIRIKGSRNTELDKMYVDDDGDAKYPYMFMNIGIYEEQDQGSDKLLEGPWIVSLAKQTPDGATIRDLSTGSVLYIQEVINDRSELIHMVAGSAVDNLSLPASGGASNIAESNRRRLKVMLLLSSATPTGTSTYVSDDNALQLSNGDNGTSDDSDTVSLYSNTGNLQVESKIQGLAAQAYAGTMTSVDGSIEQLREVTYPWYLPDYIISGGWDKTTQSSAKDLAWYRQDCFHLGDSGNNTSVSADLAARLNDYPWNNWTSMLYPQYRKINDVHTGEKMTITPVYHAIKNHLSVDAGYFVAEPVAGIEKGAITEPIELVYKANHTERGDLQEAELNPTIYEPDGIYFLTQLTTWKRLSILKRAHASKFVAYVRKMVPPLLKDILQRKATPYWTNQAQFRVNNFISRFQGAPVERYQILDSYSVNIEFDDVSSELNVYISMKPLRAIERINVFIIVQ